MNNLHVSPGKNNVGAYLNELNLNKLHQAATKKIRDILDTYGVIFIRNQNLSSEKYQNFAKSIGELVEYPRLKGLKDYPFINVLERKPTDKSIAFGGSYLHQDTSYLAKNRPRYTMLMGIEIPKGQGNTIFSSGFNAYRKLPDNIKENIKDAIGIFSSAGPISKTRRELEARAGVKSAKVLKAEHPIVHEVNGQKSLYISPGHLMKIIINGKEDEDIKKYLINHVNKEEFIFSYEWGKGDVVVWDNLTVMHKASEIKNCTRIMHRITIK